MKNLILLLALLLVLAGNNVYSQSPPCFPEFQGSTYRMSDNLNCPPYTSDMSYDVLIGYLALDSLSRYAPINTYNNFIKRQSYNDTLRTMMRYIYKTVEYNPSMFLNFMYHDKYPRRSIDDYYYRLITEILIESPNPFLDASLIGSFCIAQINVDAIYSFTDTTSKWAKSIREVTASVTSEIKGTIPTKNDIANIAKPAVKTENIPIIYFKYAKEWFMGRAIDANEEVFELEEGKSYIVFLEYRFVCRDGTDFYYEIFPVNCTGSKTACMYAIENGNVLDPNNELGLGTSVNLNTFNNLLNSRINLIKNYTP